MHHIPRTNLILVVTDGKCKCNSGQHNSSAEGGGGGGGGVVEEHGQCVADNEAPSRGGSGAQQNEVCIDSNPEEKAMREDCGGASQAAVVGKTLLICLVSCSILVLRSWRLAFD